MAASITSAGPSNLLFSAKDSSDGPKRRCDGFSGSRRQGMVTLDDYLYDLVQRDLITRETALGAAQDRADLEARLG